jgi:hypothetical protein
MASGSIVAGCGAESRYHHASHLDTRWNNQADFHALPSFTFHRSLDRLNELDLIAFT